MVRMCKYYIIIAILQAEILQCIFLLFFSLFLLVKKKQQKKKAAHNEHYIDIFV